MRSRYIVFGLLIAVAVGIGIWEKRKSGMECNDTSCTPIACTLTSTEMRQRRETVLASLKKEMISKTELEDGYRFEFSGEDSVQKELTSFMETEKQCCAFFTFKYSMAVDRSRSWIELTGPKGTKDFIKTEMGL